MAQPEKLSLSDFISRRLHPMKVTIQLLKHELERNTQGDATKVNAALLGSVVNTIELFVEDYEKLIEKTSGKPVERQFVSEDAKA